jgi:hypothetical protein
MALLQEPGGRSPSSGKSSIAEPSAVTIGSSTAGLLRAAGPDRSDRRVGTRLGKYLILSVVGRGGMGIVYEAMDTKFDRPVALKVLSDALSRNPEARSRFLSEAKAAARVEHPNVVGVYEADVADGVSFLAMPLVNGGSAADFLKARGPFNWPEAARVIADACRGLAAAHRAGLIHRDIKPANIMRARDGTVKLADFGLAMPVDECDAGRDGLLGTPSFMAPEQVAGIALDHRVDIYAMGATFYALLTAAVPYRREKTTLLLEAQVREPPPDPRLVRPEIPEAAVAIIQRAMAKVADQRYPDAEAMAADLQQLLAGTAGGAGGRPGAAVDEWDAFLSTLEARTATHAAAAHPKRAAPRPLPAWLWWVGGGAAAACIAAVGLAVYAGTSPSAPPVREPVAKTPPTPPTPPALPEPHRPPPMPEEVVVDPVMEEFAGLLQRAQQAGAAEDLAALRPALRALAAFRDKHAEAADPRHRDAAVQAGRAAESFGADLELDDVPLLSAARVVEPDVGPLFSLAIASDGRRIAVGGAEGEVAVLDGGGRRVGRVVMGDDVRITALAWSPDGVWLAGGRPDGTVLLAKPGAASDSPPVELKGHAKMVGALAFSADSARLFTGSKDSTLRVWEPASAKLLTVRRDHKDCVNAVAVHPDGRRVFTGSCDLSVQAWDLTSDDKPRVLGEAAEYVFQVAASADGRRLYVGCSDGRIQVWDLAGEAGPTAWETPKRRACRALAVSRDGRRLVSGGEDKLLRLWDTQTGRPIALLAGHAGAVRGAAFLPDGTVVSAAEDGTLRFWEAPAK